MSETAFFFPFSRSLSPLSFSSQLNAKKWAVPGCQAPSERDTQGQRRLAQRRAGRNSCTRSCAPAGRARHLPKNQPLIPPAPESCPVGLENAPPGSSTGGKKGQGEEKKKPRSSFASTQVKQKAWGGGFFFSTPPAPFPACLSPSSLLAPSIAGSLARCPSVQAEMSPGLPPSWF